MRLYRLENGVLLDREGTWLRLDDEWDAVVNRDDLAGHLRRASGAAASRDGRSSPRSAARRCGPPASPTSAAVPRA
jgi:hypothetical protein